MCWSVLGLVTLVLLAGGGGERFNSIASFMALCLLSPAVIVCFIPYIALIAVMFGTAKAYGGVSRTAQRTHALVHRLNVGTTSLSKRVAAPIIAVSARLAFLQRFLGSKPPSALPTYPELPESKSEKPER